MTRDEIIEMARQAGSEAAKYPSLIPKSEWKTLEAFAKLVAAKERKACAKVCEEYETANDTTATWLNIVAEAIRARNND